MKKYTIGVLAPSMPSEGGRRERIENAVNYLVESGYEVRLGLSTFAKCGYKSATAKQRAEDLRTFLEDPEIEVVLATTGGYNSNEMLLYLDIESLPKSKKLFVGYSDCTALTMALESKSVCVTASGPMLVDYSNEPGCFERFFEIIESGVSALCNDEFIFEKGDGPKVLLGEKLALPKPNNKGEGVALAANLSTLCLMVGTPYLPDFQGKILFLEYDKEESRALPSLERMLWQLRYAGILPVLNGLVFGVLQPGVAQEEDVSDNVYRILSEVTEGFDYPVIYNAQFGHIYPSWFIVNGWHATLTDLSIEIRKKGDVTIY